MDTLTDHAHNGKKAPPVMDAGDFINGLNWKQEEAGMPDAEPCDPEATFQKYAHLRIDESSDIPAPVPVVRIAGEIISTEGNITAVAGSPKSGKSAFCYVIVAGAISQHMYDGLEDLEVATNTDRKGVVWFDTEQSRYKHQLNHKSILKRCELRKSPEYCQRMKSSRRSKRRRTSKGCRRYGVSARKRLSHRRPLHTTKHSTGSCFVPKRLLLQQRTCLLI